jgi:cobalamin 5'-phosphate synthase/cobalamin synthase
VKDIAVALGFLTRLPMPAGVGTSGFGRAARWYPVVGAGLGGAATLAAWALDSAGVPISLTAWLLVGQLAWMTGGLHLDGLADVADGFGGGRTRDDALRIMRDPAVGAFGTTALVVVLGVKAGALTALLEREVAIPVLVAGPALARWAVVLLGIWVPSARPEGGLGDAFSLEVDGSGLLIASFFAGAVVIGLLGIPGLALWTVAVLTAAVLGQMARRRIGGVTGDVFGALVELTETTVFIGAVVLTGRAS